MRKILMILPALCLISLIITPSAYALTESEEKQSEALETESLRSALPYDASEMLSGISADDCLQYGDVLNKILKETGDKAYGIIGKGLKNAAIIISVSLVAGFVYSVSETIAPESVRSYVPIVGVLAIAAVSISDVSSFIGLGNALLGDLSVFSKALLPTLAAAASSSGALTSASVKCALAMFFIDMTVSLSKKAVMPLVYAYIAASAADAVFGNKALQSTAKVIKWIIVTVLTVITLGFVLFIAVSGVISGTADAASIRMVKTAIGTTLPVVGGILSDAANTILAGAAMLRNSIGVFGMLSVMAMCAIPFIKLAVQYICYKLTSGLSSAVADSTTANFIDKISTAFGFVLGMTGSCVVMIFVSVLSLMKAVNAV